jgi:ppGpp synthetase/RelA/SpoT-type nucleotidyltranferase
MEASLLREVEEETGLRVHLTRLLGSSQWEMEELQIAHLYFAAIVLGGETRLSDEHDMMEWVPGAKLAEMNVAPPYREFLQSFLGKSPLKEPRRTHDRQWYRAQVETYRQLQPSYEELARSLEMVLKKGTADLGLQCIVQARAKTIPSFAEKLVRPGKRYQNPLQLTDLCGARVIAHTPSGVSAVCQFVEDHFDVSWPDSGDKLESLAANEFGYLSRHYVVAFKPGKFPTEMVPTKLVEKGMKAEVQVRTILQHAWADIFHTFGYKNHFALPRRWEREFARLAAVLEESDRGFDAISQGLEEYASSYDAYLPIERLRDEMDRLGIVLELSPRPDPAIAHQVAKMAMTLGEWGRSIETLTPFAEGNQAPLLRDLGVSLCKHHSEQPDGPDFERGQKLLERATKLNSADVDAWASLGGTWRTRENGSQDNTSRQKHRQQAKDCYRRAFEIDPSDPYPLGNCIEYDIVDHPELDIVRFYRPSIEAASRRCQARVEVGIQLPWAFFDLGKFHLFLGQPDEALSHYAKGALDSTASSNLDTALTSLTTLDHVRDKLPGLDWCRRLLQLAKAWRFDQHQPVEPKPTTSATALTAPVVIVAGSCRELTDGAIQVTILDAFWDFHGTILAGGTRSGVCSLVGDIQDKNKTAVRTVGYLPTTLPENVQPDTRYNEHRRTSGLEFSPLEPLQYWTDLLISGVPRSQIRLLCLGGGSISAAECQMALAFGVPVAIAKLGDDIEGVRWLAESPWAGHSGVKQMAAHADEIRRFLGLG